MFWVSVFRENFYRSLFGHLWGKLDTSRLVAKLENVQLKTIFMKWFRGM
jgi:hypothetical protein